MKTALLILAVGGVAPLIFLRYRSGRSEALALVDTPVASAPAADYSQWETLYENASLEQVNQDIATLRGILNDGTKDYYDSEFSRGNYVVEGHYSPKQAYSLHRTGDELCARRFESSGEVRKVVLPRDQFEEMYALRDRIAWLAHRQDELAHLARHQR